MASERLDVILSLITGNYKREAREAATATGQIAGKAKETGGAVTGMADKVNSARAKFAAFAAAGAAVGAALISSIKAASDLGESINATEKVFGAASGVIATFGQVSANAVGLSTREFNQLATVTGSMLTNLGFNSQEAARQTVTLTQRASDMASVFNTDVGTALDAINSALKGEANPIEQFGVKLNDATVRARAVELGLAKTTAEVDANGKAVATLNLIYEQTSKTQGDFASTSDDLANSQRRAAAAFENAQARFGKAITPLAGNLVDRFAEGIERIASAFGDEAARKSIIFNEAIQELNKEMAAGTLGTEDLANALLHLAQNTDLTETDFETLAATVGLTQDQWEIFSDDVIAQGQAMGIAPEVLEEMVKAMSGLQEEGEGAAGGIDDVANAADNAVPQVAGLTEEFISLSERMLAVVNPAFNALTALGRYQTAQEKLNEVLKDNKPASEEAAAAGQEVLEAYNGLIAAADAYAQVSGKNLIESLIILGQEAGVPAEVIQTIIDRMAQLDGLVVRPTIEFLIKTIGTPPAVFTGGGGGKTVIGVFPQQHGGMQTPGQAYLVGERGPELVIPQQAGRVFSNTDTRQLLAALSRGGQRGDTVFQFPNATTVDKSAIEFANTVQGVVRRVESRR